MPCRSEPEDHPDHPNYLLRRHIVDSCQCEQCNNRNKQQDATKNQLLTQFLCASMSAIEEHCQDIEYFFKNVDFKECGTTVQSLLSWWNEHKKEDIKRREKERNEEEKHKLRLLAISKLTLEERKALGVE